MMCERKMGFINLEISLLMPPLYRTRRQSKSEDVSSFEVK